MSFFEKNLKCFKILLLALFSLMQSFDSSKQKLLQSDKNLINAGVSRPIPKYGSVKSGKPTRSASASDARDGWVKMWYYNI